MKTLKQEIWDILYSHNPIEPTANNNASKILQLFLDAVPKERKCPKCKKVYDEEDIDYDGGLNCGKCGDYKGDWKDVGYNQALKDTKEKIEK